MAQFLDRNRSLQYLSDADADPNSPFTFTLFDAVRDLLINDAADYSTEEIQQIATLAALLPPDGNPTDSIDTLTENEISAYHFRDEAREGLDEIVSQERLTSPHQMAIEALQNRVPVIRFFEDADRDLTSQYDLSEVAYSPPRALKHLASLADLSLPELWYEVQSQSIADFGTRRNAANRRLMEVFEENWNQQGIALQFEIQGNILHIQASTPEDTGLSDISERSDGLRWFAALLAFSHGWSDRPILLVDEIESHLHYDAQADLISVLSRQTFTSKVIYTTHSFGCLPNDLGTGVRVVQPIDNATSRLENGFWKKGAGFSPLLASMGAAAMSFTPARYALISEGPADAIMLPTLLRQASGEDELGFHIAPGLSSVAAAAIGELDSEAGRVGFIADGDQGGMNLANKLRSSGIDEGCGSLRVSWSGGESVDALAFPVQVPGPVFVEVAVGVEGS